jgi:hypothetical protein
MIPPIAPVMPFDSFIQTYGVPGCGSMATLNW